MVKVKIKFEIIYFLLVLLFNICELQFGIMREVCCCLVLVLRFGFYGLVIYSLLVCCNY